MSRSLLILTKPPYGTEEPVKALSIMSKMMSGGNEAVIYLLGDAVELTKSSQKGVVGALLDELAGKGAEIFSSEEDMLARGLTGDIILSCVKPVANIFDSLVDETMERADRVISC